MGDEQVVIFFSSSLHRVQMYIKKSGYHVVFLCFVEGYKKIEKTHRVSAQLCVIVLMNSGHQEYAKGNEDKKTVEISQG